MPTATDVKHLTIRCAFCQTWNRIDAARAADQPKCGKCAKPILLDRPLPLDDDTFDRTIAEAEIPVYVDFYADWCGPCKMMAPFVDELAKKYQGRLLVAKLNTDHARKTQAAFSVRGIPTSILFRDGKAIAQQSGAMPMQILEQFVARAL